MAEFLAVLTALGSPEDHVRRPAVQQLEQLEASNFPLFVRSLCEAMANAQGARPEVRVMAGTQLKRVLDAKDARLLDQQQKRWMLLDSGLRDQVKGLVFQLLGDAVGGVRGQAALIIGVISSVEVPHKTWPGLLQSLAERIGAEPARPAAEVEAAFKALGYVCEACNEHLTSQSNLVLNSIARGMGQAQENAAIKLAATNALLHSLEFARANMQSADDRVLIFQMIFQAARSSSEEVRVTAMMCLCEIADLHYDQLATAIRDIFVLTGTAIQKEEAGVQLQAIEFWITLAKEERRVAAHVANLGGGEVQNFNYSGMALPQLVPVLLSKLMHEDESPEDDDWNVPMAAGLCIGELAQTTGDRIPEHVLPFVSANLPSENWQLRDAAVVAFGYILDGPSKQGLAPIVDSALPTMLKYMTDPVPRVKDSASWAVGRVCDLVPTAIGAKLPDLMAYLVRGMGDTGRVAANCCFAVHNLATHLSSSPDAPNSALSPYFQTLLDTIFRLIISTRDERVLPNAFEAMAELIRTGAKDSVPVTAAVLPVVMGHLKAACADPADGLNSVLQGLLCSIITSVVQRLNDRTDESPGETARVIVAKSDELMMLLLGVLTSPHSAAHEEAFYTIGALAACVGPEFNKYMPHFFPFLQRGLENHSELGVCSCATGVLSDVSDAIGRNLVAHANSIMQILLQNLQNPLIERAIKPVIISALGDLALAVGPYFSNYMPYVMPMLYQASMQRPGELTIDEVEFINLLRQSVLNAYVGITHGVSEERHGAVLAEHLPKIAEFVSAMATEQHATADVVVAAVGLVADLASQVQGAAHALATPAVRRLILRASQAGTPAAADAVGYARQMLGLAA